MIKTNEEVIVYVFKYLSALWIFSLDSLCRLLRESIVRLYVDAPDFRRGNRFRWQETHITDLQLRHNVAEKTHSLIITLRGHKTCWFRNSYCRLAVQRRGWGLIRPCFNDVLIAVCAVKSTAEIDARRDTSGHAAFRLHTVSHPSWSSKRDGNAEHSYGPGRSEDQHVGRYQLTTPTV